MGLLGGSIGQALIARRLAGEVFGVVRRAASLGEVRKARAAHRVTLDIAEGVAGADIVILGVPVDQMEKLSREMVRSIRRDAIVTDVGSVKGCVVSKLERIFSSRGTFVGSHPMAGKEKGGIAHADPHLFEGAITIVTATKGTSRPALQTVRVLWEKIGAHVVPLSVTDHDKAVAAVSHLPHMIAVSLMHAVAGMRKGSFDPFQCVGPSFKDMTRVVASPARMWSGILVENKKEVLTVCKRFSAELGRMSAAVRKSDRRAIEKLFDTARAFKEQHNHNSA